MADYTDEDLEKLLAKEKPPFIVYFKAFFLLFIVGGGMLFVNYLAQNRPAQAPDARPTSRTLETILGAKDEMLNDKALSDLNTAFQKKGSAAVLGALADDITSEATKATNQAFDKTTDSAVSYVYENTVVKVVEKMIDSLPENERTKFREKMCVN